MELAHSFQTLELFIYLLLALVHLLIPAKTPQCPDHMCGTLCTHLAARLTPPLANGWLTLQTQLHVCVSTITQGGNRERASQSVLH